MAIKGVNPRYFAGMDAVALDPNAGKQNPAYAQMLNQAMQNRAAEAGRHRENDEENVFKAREQSQQARRDRRSYEISKRNASVNEAGEKRLQGGQDFEHGQKKDEEKRNLVAAAMKAYNDKDKVSFGYLTRELKKHGVYLNIGADESLADFEKRDPRLASPPPPPPAAKPAAPPVDRSPVPPRSPPPTASFPPAGEAEAAPPMRGAPAGVAPRSTASFPPASGAPPPRAVPAPAPPPPDRGVYGGSREQFEQFMAGARPSPAKPPPPDRGAYGDSPEQFDRNMEWKPRPPPPPPPDNVYGDSREQAERNMDWHPPTEKELLDRAIEEVVRREAAGLPPMARPLLPGKKLGAP